MKKLFLMSSMLLLTSGVFANEIVEKNSVAWACCTETETNTVPAGQAGHVSVTVKKCYEAPTHADAHSAACANARLAAVKIVEFLDDSTVTLIPQR